MNRPRVLSHRQRGVATLIVVMVLFFIVTMVAAYASRNLIFEQRTGANLYRSTQAIEVAEAGLQWTLAMLNGGRIDEQCADSAMPSSDSTFRDRYLSFNGSSGVISPRTPPSTAPDWLPTCLWDSALSRWSCSCPVSAATPPDPATGAGVAPAFRVRFQPSPGAGVRAGTMLVEVTACTVLNDNCLVSTGGVGVINEGRVVVQQLVYHTGASMSLPIAALTARGGVSAEGLTVTNSRIGDSGVTMHLGGGVSSTPNLNTLAGNALGSLASTVTGDVALNPGALAGTEPVTAAERFFSSVFNMGVATARAQPGVLMLEDCGGGCTGSDVHEASTANPGRPIWIDGDLDVSADIGSATEPVLLIVNGQINMSAAFTVHGLVIVRPGGSPANWNLPSQGHIRGAVIVDGNVSGGVPGGSFEVDYDGELLRLVKVRTGSFVAVGGGWRDGSN